MKLLHLTWQMVLMLFTKVGRRDIGMRRARHVGKEFRSNLRLHWMIGAPTTECMRIRCVDGVTRPRLSIAGNFLPRCSDENHPTSTFGCPSGKIGLSLEHCASTQRTMPCIGTGQR